jgi:hypothetical protein
MQPKSAIFISAALTAFVLATLVSVVTALRNSPAASAEAAQPATVTSAPTQELPTNEPTATSTQATVFGPMEAVSVASQFMNQQDVYSVESATYNQAPAFKVTFSSGDIVYVGLDGQVITTTKLKPVVVNVAPTKAPKKHKSSNNNNGGGQSANNGGGGGESEGDND